MTSTHADAAKMIRKQLKATWPTIKFSVHSNVSSVRVAWHDGPTDTAVEAITKDYQKGRFDGMTDSYDYSNRRDDIPQVQYVTTQRSMTTPTIEHIVNHLNRRFGYTLRFDPATGWIDTGADQRIPGGGGWQSQEIFRTFAVTSFVCTACGATTVDLDTYCAGCGTEINRTD